MNIMNRSALDSEFVASSAIVQCLKTCGRLKPYTFLRLNRPLPQARKMPEGRSGIYHSSASKPKQNCLYLLKRFRFGGVDMDKLV